MHDTPSFQMTSAPPERGALTTFDKTLRQLRTPPRPVIADAIAELHRARRQKRRTIEVEIAQQQAALSSAFHAFMALHEDTDAFARLRERRTHFLTLNQAAGGDHD